MPLEAFAGATDAPGQTGQLPGRPAPVLVFSSSRTKQVILPWKGPGIVINGLKFIR